MNMDPVWQERVLGDILNLGAGSGSHYDGVDGSIPTGAPIPDEELAALAREWHPQSAQAPEPASTDYDLFGSWSQPLSLPTSGSNLQPSQDLMSPHARVPDINDPSSNNVSPGSFGSFNVGPLSNIFKRKVSISAEMPAYKKPEDLVAQVPSLPQQPAAVVPQMQPQMASSIPKPQPPTAAPAQYNMPQVQQAPRQTLQIPQQPYSASPQMSRSGGASGVPSPGSADDDSHSRREWKLHRNRVSAQLSRARKRQLILTLEAQVAALETEKAQMQAEMAQLRTENQQLRASQGNQPLKPASFDASPAAVAAAAVSDAAPAIIPLPLLGVHSVPVPVPSHQQPPRQQQQQQQQQPHIPAMQPGNVTPHPQPGQT